ncbi:hypothetical protein phiSHEF4_51 [Enterococcus phage phiSHEF4]|uniref:Uncharacterized protein n=1 Tax=Enterococcus phage phiSHEF4 TaxID=2030923 RepID=A0A249XUL0_9CAUD|nr:tail length tape measure protein [Enterococcus phage phiSHEF4]ASZ75644.1 hypothetical protein phiSHEF4_51 [Enterococcus phage phiSHEF4]
MIKRETHLFTRQREFQEFLDRMDDDTTISHYAVNDNGTHYIITERQMSEDEAKQFKIKQLKKDIAKCNQHWEKVIKDCENATHRYNEALNFEMANVYIQRREDAIEEYNKQQRKLTNKLDKLVQLDYTDFIR